MCFSTACLERSMNTNRKMPSIKRLRDWKKIAVTRLDMTFGSCQDGEFVLKGIFHIWS